MAEDAHKAFTFELNECLWFQRGQEVEEVMGISLDPDIAVQEHEDFISVKGVIELKGEYFQVEKAERESSNQFSITDHPSQRLIEHVETYENGVNEFFHNFPVEISIPKYRINALEDVRVGIDSFDYELPENSQLQLHASVVIYGVEESAEIPRQEELVQDSDIEKEERKKAEVEAKAEEEEESVQSEIIEETFHFDIKTAVEERKDETVENIVEPIEVEPENLKSQENDKERWKNKKSQTLAEFFGQKEEKQAYKQEKQAEMKQVSAAKKAKKEDLESADQTSELESESSDGAAVSETRYLLNIFQDEEEKYSRLRMCIVQEADTLDKLAEKYQVNPLTITKSNRLETDELAEGQILYIPAK